MKQNLKFYLKEILSEKEIALVPSSFDVVGDIMIFADFPKELSKKEKQIGKIILENYHSVKSIYKKSKHYGGKFRTAKLKLIAGEKRKETIHKENAIFLKLDVEKVYFSPRTANERLRVSKLVKNNEKILVMFSGCAPFPIVLAKNSPAKIVYGIEFNPVAHEYALENIKKNKVESKVVLIKGDVRKEVPKLKSKFDRIIMPLPKDAHLFLDVALKAIKKNGTIHLYHFMHEEGINDSKEMVSKICEENKKKCKVLDIAKCGKSAPGFFRVSIDFKVI